MGRFSQQALEQPDPWAGQDDDPYEYRYDEPFVEGPQKGRIKWFEEYTSKAGNEMYKVTWGIPPAPGEPYGCKVTQYIPRIGPRLMGWLKAVAPEVIAREMDPPDAYFSGKCATVEVKREENEYMGEVKTVPRIVRVLPYSEPKEEAFEL